MNMMSVPSYQQMIVSFHNANLSIVNYNGQPYVPMKPIVEGMGLTWQSQHEKLKQRFASTITEIVIVAQGRIVDAFDWNKKHDGARQRGHC